MKLGDSLQADHIFLDVSLPDKPAVLRFAAEAFARNGIVADADALLEGLQARESVMSTGIGNGLGIPHAFSPEVHAQDVLLIRLARPIPFAAIDNRPVDLVLALAAPASDTSLHLQMLARISRIFRDSDAVRAIRSADSPEALLSAVRQAEDRIGSH
jgi:nitrogen PTS system EIIA component